MFILFCIYFGVLGIIIGSFLNVVILRHNTGKTIGGRSQCMSCGSKLTARELVPLFSFLFQRGKCKHCKTKISWQYPLVELSTGILFVLNFITVYNRSSSVIELAVIFGITTTLLSFMVATFVYDIKHKIIPDLFSFTMFGLSVVYVVLEVFVFNTWIPTSARMTEIGAGIHVFSSLFYLNIFAGVLFYIVIYLLWKVSKGRLIGLGDAKLFLSIGTLLGLVYGLSVFFLSFWIGGVFAIGLMLFQYLRRTSKHITMKSEIAFGPFIIIAFLIVYFLKIDVTNLHFIL